MVRMHHDAYARRSTVFKDCLTYACRPVDDHHIISREIKPLYHIADQVSLGIKHLRSYPVKGAVILYDLLVAHRAILIEKCPAVQMRLAVKRSIVLAEGPAISVKILPDQASV